MEMDLSAEYGLYGVAGEGVGGREDIGVLVSTSEERRSLMLLCLPVTGLLGSVLVLLEDEPLLTPAEV